MTDFARLILEQHAILMLFRLLPTSLARLPDADVAGGFVIMAPTASAARVCAANHCGGEGIGVWLSEELSTCDCIWQCLSYSDRERHESTVCAWKAGDPELTKVLLADVVGQV